MPEGYGIIQGWNGATEIAREGFGINLKISHICDYDTILCDLSKVFVGELIYLKSRAMLLEENRKSNRFEHWVTKGGKGLKEDTQEIDNLYREKWNTFHAALPNLLKQYSDNDCLTCRGIRWEVNG